MKRREKISTREANALFTLIILLLITQTVIYLFSPPLSAEVEEGERGVVKRGVDISAERALTEKVSTERVSAERASTERDWASRASANRALERVAKSIDREVTLSDSAAIALIAITGDSPMVELNSADSTELVQVRGIGPYFASQIIELRDRMGGIAHIEQLLHIWGMDSTKLVELHQYITIDTTLIVKRDLGKLSYEEISSNPYIGSYLARKIVRFRETSGIKEISLTLLKLNNIIEEELVQILLHYFK